MKTIEQSAGLGVVRTVAERYTAPDAPGDSERRLAEIESRKRADRLEKYRREIFRHAAGELNESEFTDLAKLVSDLGLKPRAIDDDCRAIRDVERCQHDIERAGTFDFPALEAAPLERRKDAKAAIMQTILDRLEDMGVDAALGTMYEVFKIHAHDNRHSPAKNYPDRGVIEKVGAVAGAEKALTEARNLGPYASEALYRTKRENPRLWPSAD